MKKREILFRAFDSNNKIMRYPSDDVYDNPNEFYGDEISIMIGLISTLNNQDNTYMSEENFSHVSVMQYTGLNDYRNNKIYEGDIVILGNHEDFKELKFIIEFIDYAWVAKCTIKGLAHTFNTIQSKDWDIKIIGNIFENKDLLK